MSASLAAWAAAAAAVAHTGPAVVLSPSLGVRPGVTVAQALAKPWGETISVPLLKGGTRALKSCDEFLAVSKGVSDAIGDRDAQALLVQAVRCQALRAVRDHRAAARSFIARFKLDAEGWRMAPPAFDLAISPDATEEAQKVAARGGSAADLEKVRIRPITPFKSEVKGGDWVGDFEILVRGLDLNGDGDEDLIVTRGVSLPQGHYQSLVYMVVTRTGPTGPLKLVDGFPRDALGLQPK